MSKLVTNAPSARHHSLLVQRFQDAVSADLAVSYVQQSGVNALRPHLARLCSEGQGVRLLCSFDMGITDPEAVGELKQLGVEVRICETQRGSFHPKVWLFANEDGSGHSLVGSANFTAGALFDNVEAGILSDDAAVLEQARTFFDRLWGPAYPVTDAEIRQWAESRQRRQAVSRKIAQADERRDERESVEVLEEFVTGWIDIGTGEPVTGPGKVFGALWRGWYIIPDQGEIDDELMARLAAICRVIQQSGGSLDISKSARAAEGTPLGDILQITSAKLRRAKRKMTNRDLFIRQEKNYLQHLGFADMPSKSELALTRHGSALASSKAQAKRIYTDAMASYIYNGLNLLAFTRRLLEQVHRLSFTEFSLFVSHAWTLDEADATALMIRIYRRLPEAARNAFVAKMDAYFEAQLGHTAKGVKMNYDKKVRHTMSALGWCDGLAYNPTTKELTLGGHH